MNAIRQLGIRTLVPTVLPPMFESWLEYRDYLVENLIQDPDKRKIFRRIFKRASYDGLFLGTQIEDRWLRACVRALVVNDYHGTTIHNAYVSMRRQALDEKKMAS